MSPSGRRAFYMQSGIPGGLSVATAIKGGTSSKRGGARIIPSLHSVSSDGTLEADFSASEVDSHTTSIGAMSL